MANHKSYNGADAVKVKCVREYEVGVGDGEDPIVYKEGKTYSVEPRTAAHLLRQLYAVRKEDRMGKKRYVGDAPFFVDEEAEAAQAKADAKAKAARDARSPEEPSDPPKAFKDMTVEELDAAAGDNPPEGWSNMLKDDKVKALEAAAEADKK